MEQGAGCSPGYTQGPLFVCVFMEFYGCTSRTGSSSFLVPCPTLGSAVLESLGISLLVLQYIKRKSFTVMMHGGKVCKQRSPSFGAFLCDAVLLYLPL